MDPTSYMWMDHKLQGSDWSNYTPWHRWGGFNLYKNAHEAQKEMISKCYDLEASDIPLPTRKPLPSKVPPLSIGQKRPLSPTMTDDTPQKKIKEDVFSDNLRSCGISVVQTSGPGQRTSTESCIDLPKDPDANPGNNHCIELCPWADCSASTPLFPFRDLPLPQFSAIDGSSKTNMPSAQHPSMLLPPKRMMTESSPPLNCIHMCNDGLPAVPAMLPHGNSHDTRPVHLDLPDFCTGNDYNNEDLPVVPAMLLSGNTCPVHPDLPDLCIGNDDDDVDLPVVNGNNVYEQGDDHLNITNGDHQDTIQVCLDSPNLCIASDGDNIEFPAMLPVFRVCSAGYDHFNIENGDSHNISPVHQNLPDLCTGNSDDNTDFLAVLPNGNNVYGQDNNHPCIANISQAHSAGLNDDDAYGQDGDHFDFENEDGNHACQVPHDDDINLSAVVPLSQICNAEVNGDKNDTSQVHCDLPDACIGVDGNNMDIEGSDEGNAEGHDDTNGNNRNGGCISNAGNDINGSDDDRESIDTLDTNGKYMDEDYYADYDGEGEACHDGEDVLRTYPEVPQGRQTGKQPQNHGHTAHEGKQKNCCGGSSSQQTWSGMDKDIALRQLLNSNQVALQTQPVAKGDHVILASAILDLQDAITQHGIGDPTLTTSEPLQATQPTSTLPEPMEGSDDPMPDYRWKSCNKQKLNLQENVGWHAVYLLKRKNRRQPFLKIASPNEMALYTVTGQGGPTADNFCLDFHGSLASAWNKCAAKVFASHFFDCGWYGSPKKDDIRRLFETHMCTLCTHSLLATLPPDTMSGDETDHQPGQKWYGITKLTWWSQAATEWLRVFDLIHLSTWLSCNGRAKCSAFPHTCIPSHQVEMPRQLIP
ncbi:hypothetical protein EDC04DRAFT_2608164 [Pisolithus marmoratus]|nr:hypothetical protein EDC04DRAFT_2608164 [Pisolithus marmoratus]